MTQRARPISTGIETSLPNLLRARTLEEVEAVRRMIGPFHHAGYRLFPLRMGAKSPRDRGWQDRAYPQAEIKQWVERGGNLGIALGPEHLVLDVDPRSGGLESLERLETSLGLDLSKVPAVLSGRGDGGKHLYFRKPGDLRVGKLRGYLGIDTKSDRGLVVAPGSRHAATGGIYTPDPAAPPIAAVAMAPAPLLEALRHPGHARSGAGTAKEPRIYRGPAQVGGGELSVEQLEALLAALDPRDYGQGNYDRWLRLAAAAHDATNGAGLEVWLTWCAGDPEYGPDARSANVDTWNSFTAGRPGGATYVSILRSVAQAGRYDLVKQVEPNLVFEDAPPMDFSAPTTPIDTRFFEGGEE